MLHAHPPALVAYSALDKRPQTEMIASVNYICNNVQTAGYALPGSKKLGNLIAQKFEDGSDIVMMASHGSCCGRAKSVRRIYEIRDAGLLRASRSTPLRSESRGYLHRKSLTCIIYAVFPAARGLLSGRIRFGRALLPFGDV